MKITKSKLIQIIKEELEESCAIQPMSTSRGEGRMAKSQLLRSLEYSHKLIEMLEDDDHLESWVQAKITLASDYLGKVYHYLHGEEVMPENPEE
tara:strand:+ start:3347 stop:3628 length:282 start_codon:yes stop_codon:yes gene_type:complete